MVRLRRLLQLALIATCASACASRSLWDWAAADSLGPAAIEPVAVVEKQGFDLLVFRIEGCGTVSDGHYALPIELGWRSLRDEQIGEFDVRAEWLEPCAPPGPHSLPLDDFASEVPVPGSADYAVEIALAETESVVAVYGRRPDLAQWVRLRLIRVADGQPSAWRPVAAALAMPFTWAFDLTAGSLSLVIGGTLAGFGVQWADPFQYIDN